MPSNKNIPKNNKALIKVFIGFGAGDENFGFGGYCSLNTSFIKQKYRETHSRIKKIIRINYQHLRTFVLLNYMNILYRWVVLLFTLMLIACKGQEENIPEDGIGNDTFGSNEDIQLFLMDRNYSTIRWLSWDSKFQSEKYSHEIILQSKGNPSGGLFSDFYDSPVLQPSATFTDFILRTYQAGGFLGLETQTVQDTSTDGGSYLYHWIPETGQVKLIYSSPNSTLLGNYWYNSSEPAIYLEEITESQVSLIRFDPSNPRATKVLFKNSNEILHLTPSNDGKDIISVLQEDKYILQYCYNLEKQTGRVDTLGLFRPGQGYMGVSASDGIRVGGIYSRLPGEPASYGVVFSKQFGPQYCYLPQSPQAIILLKENLWVVLSDDQLILMDSEAKQLISKCIDQPQFSGNTKEELFIRSGSTLIRYIYSSNHWDTLSAKTSDQMLDAIYIARGSTPRKSI
jgi:hypothetical protein